ncbi:sugar phosphate nucleotidyltransferase [Chloroflexota bacterium]
MGTRLKPLTLEQPKSLMKVLGKPFLLYQLELLKGQGLTEILLCTGYLGEKIERHFGSGEGFGVNLKYSREERPLGTAGALKKAQNLLRDPFFTLYGDSYVFVDFSALFRHFENKNKLALMSVYRNCDRYDDSNTVVIGEFVKRYSKKKKTPDMAYIDYGVNLFRKKVLDLVPEGDPCRLDDLFPRLIEIGELLAYEVGERFYEIGSPQGLKDFEEFSRSAPA